MDYVCLTNCRDIIFENEDEIELKKFRGVKKLSEDLLEMFRFDADIAGQCDYYFNECIEASAIDYCKKVGINYFNSYDMHADVSKHIEDNKDIIDDDVFTYIKKSINLGDFKIVVRNYVSCHSDLIINDGNCIDGSKEENRIREFAIDYVYNVFISVAYRYLWSCIFGSQRNDFKYFKH